VDEYLPPWQRELLGEFRALVHEVEPAITEGWKWMRRARLESGQVPRDVAGCCCSCRGSADAVECGLQDGLEVAGVAADGADGDDQVEDLLEREVVADFSAVLGGEQQWPAGGEDPGAAVVEDGVVPVGLLEQFGGDVVLAGEEPLEAAQPRGERLGGRVAGDRLGGRADGVDLFDVEGFQELSAAGEVAVERRHANAGAS